LFFSAFCVSVKVKPTVPLLCVCVHSAWKGRPRNDLYCVGWDVKPYSLTHVCFIFASSCKHLIRRVDWIRIRWADRWTDPIQIQVKINGH